MKMLSCLFAFYVLFLSLQPVVKDFDSLTGESASCCNTACESGEDEPSKKGSEKGNDREADSCNPFQCLECCNVFNTSVHSYGIILNPDFTKMYTKNSVGMLPEVSPDFWQPPRIA